MDPSSATENQSASSWLLYLARVLLGFLLLGFCDLLASYAAPGPELGGSRESLAMVTLMMGRAALVGFLAALFLASIGWLANRAFPRSGVYVLAACLGVLAFWFLNQETFDGAAIQANERLAEIKIAFYGIGIAVILAAVWHSRKLLRRHQEGSGPSRSLAVAGLVLANLVLWQNVVQLAGLYWMLHAQLALIAAILLVFGPGIWWVTTKTRAQAVMALAAIFIVGALLVRSTSINVRVESASLVRATACREFRPLTARIFDLVTTAYRSKPGDIKAATIPRDTPADQQKAESWFRDRMGELDEYNVLLIAVDTLRADHCGFLGYDKNPTTPNLDELASQSFVFTRAYSTYPTSNVSYSSILTGLLPRATPAYARIKRLAWQFDPLVPTPALIADSGRKTVGITAFNADTAQNDDWFGLLRRGFDIYNPDQEKAQLPADKITDSAIGQLRTIGRQPFFMWAHYLDPHDPYKTHPGIDFGGSKTDRYDADINWTDKHVGRLIGFLKEAGLFDKTIIALVSDHGEEFNEHGGWRHNSSVYEEQIRVPFLLRVPGVPGRAIDKIVSLVDLHPTLTSLLNIKDPLPRHGQSLLPVMADENNARPGFAYAEHFYLVSRKDFDNKKAIISGNKKLIAFPQRESYEIYDLEADPQEKRNLIGRDQQAFTELAGLMAAIDEELDGYHLKDGESKSNPRQEFRATISDALTSILSNATTDSDMAFKTLRSQLFLALGELSPNALKYFSPEERREMALRLAAGVGKIEDAAQRNDAVKVLCLLRQPETYTTVEALFNDASYAVRFSAALGLATNGVKSAQPYLQVALRSKLADPSKIAAALARLSDPQAGPWVFPTLLAPSKALVGAMIQQLPHIQIPDMGYYIRDLLTEGRWNTRMEQGALAKALATMTEDPDLKWLLFYLTGNSGTAVRQFAEESLRQAGVSDEEIATNRKVVDLEVDASVEIKNRVFAQAFEHMRKALKLGPTFNAGLRFRLARYLHLEGRVDEARQVLEEIEKEAANPLDVNLARRRIQQLAWPARLQSVDDFGLTIIEAGVPARMTASVQDQFTVRVKNTGKTAIQGGYWLHSANLVVGWLDDKGEVMQQELVWDNFLPPGGILPGEELTLSLVASPPDGRDIKARAFIRFEQPWFELAEPRIYVHSNLTTIGVAGR